MLGIRKRCWIVASILLAAGLIFLFFVYAYQFTGLFLCGCSALVLLFGFLNGLKRKLFRSILLCLIVLGILCATVTGVRIGLRCGGSREPGADFAVVLGAGVNGTKPSASLLERLQAAQRYLQTYPDSVLILSGSQGENEEISEAQCMFDWLTDHGVPASRLYMEDQSDNTAQNLAYSLNLIEKEFGSRPDSLCIISSDYHLLRAEGYAKELGIRPLLYPARTENRLYFGNMFLREIFGLWKQAVLG